jgi:hypothetical protein
MLEPAEYFGGKLSAAPVGSLILPRHQYEFPFLMGTSEGNPIGVFLDGQYRFSTVDNRNFDHWGGLIIPNVAILADEFALTPEVGRWGTLIRARDKIAVAAAPPMRHGFGQVMQVDLVTDLLSCGEGEHVGFLHWQIVLRAGSEQRVLFDVDLRESTQTQ